MTALPIEDVETFEVQVGTVTSPDGRTSLTVAREGTFVVTHEGPSEDVAEASKEQYEGNVRELLDIEPARLIAELAEAVPAKDDFPQRPGIPDEPIVRLTIRSGREAHSIRMWLRDVEADAQLARSLERLRSIVDRSTDGQRFL